MMWLLTFLILLHLLLDRIMKSIDAVLHLSDIFGLSQSEPGILVVEFMFSVIWQLLDASLDDEGLLELTPEKKSTWATLYQEMEVDRLDNYDSKKTEHHEKLQSLNTVMAIEMIGQFLQDKISSRLLYLACQNLYVFYCMVSHLKISILVLSLEENQSDFSHSEICNSLIFNMILD